MLVLEQVIVRMKGKTLVPGDAQSLGHNCKTPSKLGNWFALVTLSNILLCFVLFCFLLSWENFVSVPSILCFCQCLIIMKG